MDQIQRASAEAWDAVCGGLRFPAYTEASEPLAAATISLNDRVAETTGRLKKSRQAVADAIAQVDAGQYGDFVTALQQSEIDAGTLIQEIATLWAERENLAKRAAAEFAAQLPPAEREYEATVKTVREDFERIGSGRDAFPPQGNAGELQMDWFIRNRNVHTLAAAATVRNIRARVDGANEQVHLSSEGRANAHVFVQKIARKMAAM